MPPGAPVLTKMPHWRLPGNGPARLGAARPRALPHSRSKGWPCTARPSTPPASRTSPTSIPHAPKGGRIALGALGTFDSLNPFIIKGVTPSGLREYVYESLMARSGDEPFTLYGLIAETVEVPDDRSSITFHLRPEARFSDGTPITPEDVLFSHQILKEKGWPYHRSHYAKVAKAEKTGAHSVRFTFDAAGDREIPLILGLLPVLPRHHLTPRPSSAPHWSPGRQRPLPGRARSIRAAPSPIAAIPTGGRATSPSMRGRFNFEEIRVEYFRDSASLFEAFKAGEIDVRTEDDPGRWIEGYGFPAVTDGRVVKREFETRPALRHGGARLQHAPADLRGRPRAPRLPPAVRRRLDQPQPVQRRLQAHAELLRALRALLARPPRRRARARRCSLPSPPSEARDPGRHLALPVDRRQRRQPRQSAGSPRAPDRGRLRAEGGRLVKGRRAARLRVAGPDPPAGAPDAQLRPHAGAARHRPQHPPGRHGAVLVAPQELRLRHDPVDLERLAVARQRADQPLEQQGGRHRGLAQLSRAPRTPPPTP